MCRPYSLTKVEARWWYLFGETIQNVIIFWSRCGSHRENCNSMEHYRINGVALRWLRAYVTATMGIDVIVFMRCTVPGDICLLDGCNWLAIWASLLSLSLCNGAGTLQLLLNSRSHWERNKFLKSQIVYRVRMNRQASPSARTKHLVTKEQRNQWRIGWQITIRRHILILNDVIAFTSRPFLKNV